MPSTTNFSWPLPASSDLVTDAPVQFSNLGQAADTTVYDRTRPAGGRWTAATGLVAGWTNISWNAESEDTDGFLTPSSVTVTIPAGLGGLYMVTVRVATALTTAVTPEINVRWSTSAYGTLYDINTYTNNASYLLGGTARASLTCMQRVDAGDTITVFARCSSNAANATEELRVERVGL